MLRITVPGDEVFDESTSEFGTHGDVVLELEHSLISLSKWESEFERPFLSDKEKTAAEIFSYIKHMLLIPNVPDEVLRRLTETNVKEITQYIEAKMSATFISSLSPEPKNKEVVTSELIYYWMVALQIPFECQHWHLNRLFTLIQVCNVKQSKPKKMSKGEIARRNRELNEQRKRQLGTRG
jgi:hypothetical protein